MIARSQTHLLISSSQIIRNRNWSASTCSCESGNKKSTGQHPAWILHSDIHDLGNRRAGVQSPGPPLSPFTGGMFISPVACGWLTEPLFASTMFCTPLSPLPLSSFLLSI